MEPMWEMIIEACENINKTVLHWSYRDLKEFPENLKDLNNAVQELYLKENYISVIPKWFLCNTNLKLIHLAGNCIKNIPEEISLLHNLEFLDLSDNCLEELPRSIWQLKRLTDINVGGNQIQYVPEEIGRLKQLQVLNLGQNHIRSLPPEIGHCVNLMKLILNENKFLQSIPEIIVSLPNLRELCADKCSLLYLPFFLSKSIKYLQIFNNQYLTHIPVSYWKFFTRYYEVPYISNSCMTTPSSCYTIIEKKTNRYLRLCPRTKKVFCCLRNRHNGYSLFEHCLRSIHKWSNIGVKLDTTCLPTTLRDYVKNGPITKCLYKFCNSLLFSEYFLLIFTGRNNELITGTFCSRSCGLNWIIAVKLETFTSCWESCQI